jgi:hypothetical protein
MINQARRVMGTFSCLLVDGNGPIDLRSASRVKLKAAGGTKPKKWSVPIVAPEKGEVFVPALAPGYYQIEFEIHWKDGGVETVPNSGSLSVVIEPSGPDLKVLARAMAAEWLTLLLAERPRTPDELLTLFIHNETFEEWRTSGLFRWIHLVKLADELGFRQRRRRVGIKVFRLPPSHPLAQ